MVYFVGTASALLLGLGYVLQQRVAAQMPLEEVLKLRLLIDLMHRPMWWLGIGSMVAGQALSGLALQLATVAVVEPLLSTSLLFALAFAASAARHRIRWHEVTGALVLSSALALFLAVGQPHSSPARDTSNITIGIAVACVIGAVAALTAIARTRGLVAESVLLATAAGILYGLQDAATRAAFLRIKHHGIATLPVNPWMWVVVGAAAIGILLSQSAFKTARLDYSLPPISASEPVVGIVLGISLLGDVVSVSRVALASEALCVVGIVAGAILIARSPNLKATRERVLHPREHRT
jgi:drug/metabolite transporter (DMT)-like permease